MPGTDRYSPSVSADEVPPNHERHRSARVALIAGCRTRPGCGRRFCGRLGDVSRERAAEVMRKMVAMFSTGDLSDIQETVHPDYFDHQGLHGEPIRGPAGFESVVAAARASFATLEVTVEDLIAGRDRAAARLQWNGLRPEGQVSRQTVEIVRIKDGMAVEHWGGRS